MSTCLFKGFIQYHTCNIDIPLDIYSGLTMPEHSAGQERKDPFVLLKASYLTPDMPRQRMGVSSGQHLEL